MSVAKDTIYVGPEDFSLDAITRRVIARNPQDGAIVHFVGVVRNHHEGVGVASMRLEHYPGMTEKSLRKIIEKARQRWSLGDVWVHHRVGPLTVGDSIVLCLVSSPHRQRAFDACAFIMDWLKSEAPFWKKEQTEHGARWVDARESDEKALRRWQN